MIFLLLFFAYSRNWKGRSLFAYMDPFDSFLARNLPDRKSSQIQGYLYLIIKLFIICRIISGWCDYNFNLDALIEHLEEKICSYFPLHLYCPCWSDVRFPCAWNKKCVDYRYWGTKLERKPFATGKRLLHIQQRKNWLWQNKEIQQDGGNWIETSFQSSVLPFLNCLLLFHQQQEQKDLMHKQSSSFLPNKHEWIRT